MSWLFYSLFLQRKRVGFALSHSSLRAAPHGEGDERRTVQRSTIQPVAHEHATQLRREAPHGESAEQRAAQCSTGWSGTSKPRAASSLVPHREGRRGARRVPARSAPRVRGAAVSASGRELMGVLEAICARSHLAPRMNSVVSRCEACAI